MRVDHFGVYARIVDRGRLLCVRKTRGLFTGQLDLPGGRPEMGESHCQTLWREVLEETGRLLAQHGKFHPVRLHLLEDSFGVPADFHHHGVWAEAAIQGAPDGALRSSDTAGAQWFDIASGDRRELSALATAVLTPPPPRQPRS